MSTPSEPPPPYEAATAARPAGTTGHLNVPQTRNGISPEHRRSMEDEQRPLPPGWVRQFDRETHHQFFVDTSADPPRSIWHHPYDDEDYLKTLSRDEREKVTRLHHSLSLKDITAESSDDEAGPSSRKPIRGGAASSSDSSHAPEISGGRSSPQPEGLHRFGRKMKDRITRSTHEEREGERARRGEEERQAYEAHLRFREAMQRAVQTGQPQYLGKDKNGHDVYLESPSGPALPMGARGYNPYSSGPYADSNARFVRPNMPYSRPMGYGYGGGYGFPLAGGLLGGMMLGGLLF